MMSAARCAIFCILVTLMAIGASCGSRGVSTPEREATDATTRPNADAPTDDSSLGDGSAAGATGEAVGETDLDSEFERALHAFFEFQDFAPLTSFVAANPDYPWEVWGENERPLVLLAANLDDPLGAIKSLHELGADINRQCEEFPPVLFFAVGYRRFDLFQWLLENGANPDLQDPTGRTIDDEIAMWIRMRDDNEVYKSMKEFLDQHRGQLKQGAS